jgi:hypothetical protein
MAGFRSADFKPGNKLDHQLLVMASNQQFRVNARTNGSYFDPVSHAVDKFIVRVAVWGRGANGLRQSEGKALNDASPELAVNPHVNVQIHLCN